jgi:hypothetical protein
MAAALGWVEPSAHCSLNVPAVQMQFPAPGTAIQTYYIAELDYRQTDTFYQDTLNRQLADLFRASRHVILGNLDSVKTRLIFDSIWYLGQLIAVDTFREQSLWIRALDQFKGSLPAPRLFYLDTLNFYSDTALKLLQWDYAPLVDTPFVAFFNVDLLGDAGIGPTDCSFFEPQAFMVIGGRIHKKGAEYYRMAGVSVAFDSLLSENGATFAPAIKADTLIRNLPFRFGKTRLRRVFPGGNGP